MSIGAAQDLWKQIYERGRQDNAPWLQTGQAGINRLGFLLGLTGDETGEGYGSLTQRFGMDQFEQDPGYAFRLSEGNKALERAQAARGNYMSPAAIKALGEYGQNLASQEYGNAYNRYRADMGDIFNRLYGVSSQGQQAANIVTNLGQNYAGGMSQLYQQQAALDAAKSGGGGLGGSLFGGLANLAGGYFSGGGTLSGLFGGQ